MMFSFREFFSAPLRWLAIFPVTKITRSQGSRNQAPRRRGDFTLEGWWVRFCSVEGGTRWGPLTTISGFIPIVIPIYNHGEIVFAGVITTL